LRTVRNRGVAAEQGQVVGKRVVFVIQLEAQADLRQARIRRQFVEVGFRGGQVDAVPAASSAASPWMPGKNTPTSCVISCWALVL